MKTFHEFCLKNPFNDASCQLIKIADSSYLDFLKLEKNSLKARKDQSLIPKIIHLIWLGSRDFPLYALNNLSEWILLNPGYQINLWVDNENLKSFPIEDVSIKYLGKDYTLKYLKTEYDKHDTYAGKADILRVELLYEFGGFYTDYDNRCCKNLNLFAEFYELVVAFDWEPKIHLIPDPVTGQFIEPRLANSFFAVKKQHPLFLDMFERIKKAHAFFLSKSDRILGFQIIYSTYVHFTLAVANFLFQNQDKAFIIPVALGWKHLRKELIGDPDADPYLELSYLPSVGWKGECYDLLNFKNSFLV